MTKGMEIVLGSITKLKVDVITNNAIAQLHSGEVRYRIVLKR